MKLGSLALRQRRSAYTQGERDLFLVQADGFWDGGQHFDLGEDVRGDRVRVVLGTRHRAGRRNGIKSRTRWQGGKGCKAVEHYPAALRVEDIVSGEERRAEGGNPRGAGRLRIREPRGGKEVVLGARKALPAVSVEIARGEPARDGQVEHDVPGAGLLSILVAFTAEFDGRLLRGDKFLGDCAETDGGVARFLRDEFSLSLESDDQ